ncbi:MAG: pseudouridine synthase [Prochlorococcaceae cyanobacterium]
MPAALNRGHAYRDRVTADESGQPLSAVYASRHAHSGVVVWRQRLAAGEICRNGRQLRADVALAAGDQLVWHRPPWQEAAVPVLPGPLFDDGDLLVFNKPSGLPVLPAGGFLEHTVLAQLQARWPGARPVHRLGRFTSGLLVCARSRASRAWLSALLRQSTAAAAPASSWPAPARKIYRALSVPLASDLAARLELAGALELSTPIARRPHPLLGRIWCAATPGDASDPGDRSDPAGLSARSLLSLVEQRPGASLLELAIASGRPHQIRIHCAAAGAPLLGDPLYGPGGLARADALPGDGGYHLHAHRLQLPLADGTLLEFEAPLPEVLRAAAERG